MVKRFRRGPIWPKYFQAERMRAEQSSVPSQYMRTPPPFENANLDIMREPPPNIRDFCIVRSVFDSRPKYAYDFFYDEFSLDITGNSIIVGGAVQQTIGFVVPQGYTLFLRRVCVELHQSQGQNATFLAGPIDTFGNVAAGIYPLPSLQLLVNNAPPAGWPVQSPPANAQTVAGGIPLPDLYNNEIEVPCFVICDGGSTVRAQLGFAFAGFVLSNANYARFAYSGTIIMDTGQASQDQVGNAEPEPVTTYEPLDEGS